jgi:hypothetical protein
VIDLLGDTGGLTFFCVHDADAYGTTIYQTLQGATSARDGRRVQVINLGLEPQEALQMGLPVEKVGLPKKGKRGVAAYVPKEWADWLQTQRVELNAMTTPQFIEWLDRKLEGYTWKVVPPDEVLSDRLKEEVRKKAKEAITARILKEEDLDGQVKARCEELTKDREKTEVTLRDRVLSELEVNDSQLWARPVERVADELLQQSGTE